MSTPLRVYVGWDARDSVAYEVCVRSLVRWSSIPLDIRPLKDWELRRKGVYRRSYHVEPNGYRRDDVDGQYFGTDFSFSRFLVPALANYGHELTLFVDPDVMWRGDIAELLELVKGGKGAVHCVQHEHCPTESTKGVGPQARYARKNWSSLMVFNPAKNTKLTVDAVNTQTGRWLHGMRWLPDKEIGSIHEEWNWLEGWSNQDIEPKMVHFTRGTPDMPGYEDVMYAEEWRRYATKHHDTMAPVEL